MTGDMLREQAAAVGRWTSDRRYGLAPMAACQGVRKNREVLVVALGVVHPRVCGLVTCLCLPVESGAQARVRSGVYASSGPFRSWPARLGREEPRGACWHAYVPARGLTGEGSHDDWGLIWTAKRLHGACHH